MENENLEYSKQGNKSSTHRSKRKKTNFEQSTHKNITTNNNITTHNVIFEDITQDRQIGFPPNLKKHPKQELIVINLKRPKKQSIAKEDERICAPNEGLVNQQVVISQSLTNYCQSFADLPKEILLQIFGYLDTSKVWLGRCSQVCRRWKQVAEMDSLWKNIFEMTHPDVFRALQQTKDQKLKYVFLEEEIQTYIDQKLKNWIYEMIGDETNHGFYVHVTRTILLPVKWTGRKDEIENEIHEHVKGMRKKVLPGVRECKKEKMISELAMLDSETNKLKVSDWKATQIVRKMEANEEWTRFFVSQDFTTKKTFFLGIFTPSRSLMLYRK